MNKEKQVEEQRPLEPHHAARPMKIIKDEKGEPWLCDENVDPEKDLRKQGCWNCGDLAFTRDD